MGSPWANGGPTARRYASCVVSLLLLVRHALTESTGKRLTGWQPGVHLSARGQKQAEALAERLGPLPIGAIYSSPLERCRETAAPLAKDRR